MSIPGRQLGSWQGACCAMALLACAAGPAAQQRRATWKAGAAKVSITPEEPMWMAGYAGRRHPAHEKLQDLWAKALVLEDTAGARAVLVTLEVTGIDRRFSLAVRDALKERYGLERRQVALCSTHTHSGPVTGDRFTFVFGLSERHDALRLAFLARLEQKIVAVVGAALERMEPCVLAAGSGRAEFAFNRRDNREHEVVALRAQGKLRGPMDLTVPVLAVRSARGELLAVGFGYACHCTTLGPANDKWCGDYAGFAQGYLEEAHPGSIALFWAGCGGDQNPGPRRELRHARDHGRSLAAAVEGVLAAAGGQMAPVRGSLAVSYREVELPFAAVPTLAELRRQAAEQENPGMARRACFLLDRVARGHPLRPTYPYPVQVWRLGAELLFVALGGEAVVDYARAIKKEHGAEHTWVASYANDVMAYIPSRRVLREGGYEGRTSMMVYGLPSPWGPQVGPLILHSVRQQVQALGARGRTGSTTAAIDFEDSGGMLDPARWYVSGGMDATRLRNGPRGHAGSWALSTAGDGGYPTFTCNVAHSRIDADTSVAWGPFFTLHEKLPVDARITCDLAGGSKPWRDTSTSGPTGLALWDVAAADFARDESGRVIYAARRTNGFDFEAASLSLAGLEGRTLGLALVDRATQSWAWTSVDRVVLPAGCYAFSDHLHHQVTVLGDFDAADSLSGWTGDTRSFGLGPARRGEETPLFIHRRVQGGTFPTGAGYLTSSAAGEGEGATGVLRSPAFALDGHILEFYLAGDPGDATRLELVSPQGKVLARASPDARRFVYRFWRIEPEWRGMRAHVRLVDRSRSGHIEVDALRIVRFDVPAGEAERRESRPAERPLPPRKPPVRVPKDPPARRRSAVSPASPSIGPTDADPLFTVCDSRRRAGVAPGPEPDASAGGEGTITSARNPGSGTQEHCGGGPRSSLV